LLDDHPSGVVFWQIRIPTHLAFDLPAPDRSHAAAMGNEAGNEVMLPSVEGISRKGASWSKGRRILPALRRRLLVHLVKLHGHWSSWHHAPVRAALYTETLLVDRLQRLVFGRVARHGVVLHLLRLVSSAEAFHGRLMGSRQPREASIGGREGAVIFVWRPGKHLLSNRICSDAIESQG